MKWKEEFKTLCGYCSVNDMTDFISNLLEEQRKETIEEVKKDLLDITKGIDDDGSEYIACQLDYFDIEESFKRYE